MIGGIKSSTAIDDLGEGITKQPVSQNKAVINFALTLPEGQSDLVQAITRNPTISRRNWPIWRKNRHE